MTPDGPTDALPTRPRWAEIAAHRPLEADDPREVGGYRLRASLGEGGMGRVYLSNTPGGRPIALKVIRAEYAGDPAFRRRFEQEVATAQRVQGPFTAPVIDANPHSEQPWLATAYVAGPSLQQAVGVYGPLPPESVLILVAGVAEALQSIHAVNVVHRDLKPSNVILAADGPRVIDFGIARAVDTTSVTQVGMRVGTPAFMAPEQVRGQPVTPALDIFALGSLAVYAATGELPFGGGLDPAVPYRILEQEPDLAACPPQLRELVTRCLAKDPRQRPSPAQVIELCRQASTGTLLQMGEGWLPPAVAAAVSRIAVAPIPAPTPRKRSRGRVLAVVALVALAAGTGVGAAAVAGAFDAKDPAQTQPGPSSAPTTSTDGTKPRPSTNTTAPTSTSDSGTDPEPDVRIEALDVPANAGINLAEPKTMVGWDSFPDVAHFSAGQISVNDGRVVILEDNQTADYRTCTTDTRYTLINKFTALPVGTRFCVLGERHVALFEIKQIPDSKKLSKYYQFAITIWRA